jgi:CheY-like chemotaxis protein
MPGKPILIVDDNPSNLKLMRVLLSGEGYEVRTAHNAEEALGSLPSFHPALILMDIQMPGMDGLELTRRIKADPNTSAVPVVAITAYAMSGDEARAKEAGCDAYVTKPIDTRALPKLISNLI